MPIMMYCFKHSNYIRYYWKHWLTVAWWYLSTAKAFPLR